jgi:predicted nucleic acid-binding protein
MRKIFLDTNIFIDILLDSDIEHISIEKITPYLESSKVYMSTLSVHITYYILKIKPNTKMNRKAVDLINVITLVPLSKVIVNKALDTFKKDFEDTLQYFSALDSDCDYILTRDTKDFRKICKHTPSDIQILDTLENLV